MVKVVDADRPEIERRLAEGESLRQIAKSYGVAYQTLQAKRRKWGEPLLRPARTSGEQHASWRGGWYIDQWGYKMVLARHRGNTNPYVGEHVLVAEAKLGRQLRRGEVVHHINGDKADNQEDNLLVCTQSQHRLLHRQLEVLALEFFREGKVSFVDGRYVRVA